MPECTPWSSVRDLHDAVGEAAQRRGQRRHADVPVGRVGDARSRRPRARRGALEDLPQRRRARLLLALDEDRDADRRPPPCARNAARCVAMPALSSAAPRPYSRPSRSVGSNGADAHCAAVALGLDVVVGVQQHRRRASRRRVMRDHGGCTAFADDLDVGEARCDNSSATASALRSTSSRRAGSAPTEWMRTRFSRSRRTDGQHIPHAFHQIAHQTRLAGPVLRASRRRMYNRDAKSASLRLLRRASEVSRMATAAAISPSWVSETWMVTSARYSAIAPVNRTRGRPTCR